MGQQFWLLRASSGTHIHYTADGDTLCAVTGPVPGPDVASSQWERRCIRSLGTREEATAGRLRRHEGGALQRRYSPGLVRAEASAETAGAATRAVACEQQGAVAELSAFQAIDTAIFWHLIPSLDLSGPHSLRDERYVSS